MSWNEDDRYYYEQQAAEEEFIDEISRQARDEFINERLQSFYLKNPNILEKGLAMYKEGKALYESKFYSAAIVFFMSSIEIFLKLSLVKPVIYGLSHHEGMGNIILEIIMQRLTCFDSYTKLLKNLFSMLTREELDKIQREEASNKLLEECKSLQKLRNEIIHNGDVCDEKRAKEACQIVGAVFNKVVVPMLDAMNLTIEEKGVIKPY